MVISDRRESLSIKYCEQAIRQDNKKQAHIRAKDVIVLEGGTVLKGVEPRGVVR